jgi:glycosyltransferase involved in cell wall biosynthesis
MRVLYVTDALAVWGGIERVLSDKMNFLVQHYGYEIYVVTADQGAHPIPFKLDERIIVKDLNIRFHQQYQYYGIKRLLKHWELEKLLRDRLALYMAEISPDVISCIRDGYASAVLDLKIKIPTIFESHAMFKDVDFENSTFIHRITTKLFRRKFKRLDRLITLTHGDANDWKRVCDKVSVIPNVVHLNESGKYSQCRTKRAIFAGRFDLQKDVESLARVWFLVQHRHPDWVLEVYGNGKMKPHFRRIVEENKLNVIISPAVPNILSKFIESSILLMTSLYEPFGLVLVEAMSCGVPVVAFDCPYGPADIIHDGVDGYLVKNRDVEAYSDHVCYLIENESQRKKMGHAAILSSQRYNANNIMPLWTQLFNELVAKRHGI